MLQRFGRYQAWLVACLLVIACAWATTVGLDHADGWTAVEDLPYSDVQLYRDISERVADGENYYSAATDLHRKWGFPTAPFVTVRLPTMAIVAAMVGWDTLQIVLIALLAATVLVWHNVLGGSVSKATRIAVVAALVVGGFVAFLPIALPHHDQWAGLLLTLAIPLRGGRTWPVAVVCAALALAIRELAIPFVLLAFCFAIIERSWREAVAWGTLIAVFTGFLAWHATMVQAFALPTDVVSPGWSGFQGPTGAISDIVEVSVLKLLPAAIAAPLAVLALFGWLGAPDRIRTFGILWLVGFATALALFARPENTYWAIELMPAWLVGLAFLPTAARDLWTALESGPRQPAGFGTAACAR